MFLWSLGPLAAGLHTEDVGLDRVQGAAIQADLP